MLRELFETIRADKTWVTPSLDEYFLFQKLVDDGDIVFKNFDEIAFVIRTLWLKSPEHTEKFNRILESRRASILEFISKIDQEISFQPNFDEHLSQNTINRDKTEPSPLKLRDETLQKPGKEQPSLKSVRYSDSDQNINSYHFSIREDGKNLDAIWAEIEQEREKFLFTKDYFPVKSRFLQHSFRSLISPSKGRYEDEIDINATIQSIATKGYLSAFEMIRKIDNQLHLFILSDRRDSMMVIEEFASEIFYAANQTSLREHSKHLSFNKVPIRTADNAYILRNDIKKCYEALPNLFAGIGKKEILVLIYSDTGSLQNEYEEKIIDAQLKFIEYLNKKSSYIAWINPAPKARWSGTNAEIILEHVPMFEANREGFDSASQVLKGRKIR